MANNKKNVILGLFLFYFISLLFCPISSSADTINLKLATGSKAGVYYPIGQGIADIGNKAGITIEVINTEGSFENLNLLNSKKVDLCIAQSDTVYNAYNGLGRFSQKISGISVIASLYTEVVHVIVRNPLYIKKIEDFRGKRISLGPTGSGTEINAHAVLESAGISQNEFEALNLSFDESIRAIRENRADIIFITSGYPSDAVNKMLENGDAYLFELKSDNIQRMIESRSYFVVTNIPAGTYPHQDEEMTTIGIAALLVGSSSLDATLIYNLTKSIFSGREVISQYHPTGKRITLNSALRGITSPIYEGSIKFYKEQGLLKNEFYKKIFNYSLVLVFLLLLVVAILNKNKVVIFFRRQKIGRIFVILLLVWFVNAYVLYFAEHKINDNYSSVFMSLWSGLVNLINFGSKEPFTNTGRTASTIMMILWVIGIACFTAQMAAYFVNYELKGKRKMKNHYIIINWSSKTEGIIRQLKSPDLRDRDITIVTESDAVNYLNEIDDYKSVRIIRGNPSYETILNSANILDAYSIVILADNDKEGNVSDAGNVLILMAIRRICKDRRIPIIIEIIEPPNVATVKDIIDKDGGAIEVVSTKYLGEKLISQAIASPGLSKIYDDLLTFDEGSKVKSKEIYRMETPEKARHFSFKNLLELSLKASQEGIDVLPFAVAVKDDIFINPLEGDASSQLKNCDYYFAIASRQNDLKLFNKYVEKHCKIS